LGVAARTLEICRAHALEERSIFALETIERPAANAREPDVDGRIEQ
jgi:hypothetical protein